MATFKPIIFKERQREDKTWTVFIRFTHERKMRYIATTMYVGKKEITSSGKIKGQSENPVVFLLPFPILRAQFG